MYSFLLNQAEKRYNKILFYIYVCSYFCWCSLYILENLSYCQLFHFSLKGSLLYFLKSPHIKLSVFIFLGISIFLLNFEGQFFHMQNSWLRFSLSPQPTLFQPPWVLMENQLFVSLRLTYSESLFSCSFQNPFSLAFNNLIIMYPGVNLFHLIRFGFC